MVSAARLDSPPITALEVRQRLVEALKLDLVGPWAGHPLADERLPGWVRPATWYLTGFLIPSGTPPEQRGDADEDDDLDEVPASAGLAEESSDERKAAKKGYFPSSMGLSFLVDRQALSLAVTVRWGDYAAGEIEGTDGKPLAVWQRSPREETVEIALDGASGEPLVCDVPGSGGLQLTVVVRPIDAEDLAAHLPPAPVRCPSSWSTTARRSATRPIPAMPFNPRSRCAAIARSSPALT